MNLAEHIAYIQINLGPDICPKTHSSCTDTFKNNLFQSVKRPTADEENIRCIYLHKFLVRVLAPALGGYTGYCSFQYLQQRLLNTFTGDIPRNGRIFAFSGYFIKFININDTLFCFFQIVIGRLD